MRIRTLLASATLLMAASACTTPVGPVEVTRFHDPTALGELGRGTIAVVPAPGFAGDPSSLEFASYRTAVERELERIGYAPATSAAGGQVAELRIERYAFRPEREGGPVSVGVGGHTGSWGSGVGVGIGLDLSGPPPEQVTTEMGLMIKDRASGATLWEGRASFTVRASSPLAQTQLGAAKIAEALFRDFPGRNGETIRVE